MAEVDAISLDEIRRSATCPACGEVFREPRVLEPCEHTVCRGCLGQQQQQLRGIRPRCPVCLAPCTADRPYSSMSALACLLNAWPAAALTDTPAGSGSFSSAAAARPADGPTSGRRTARPRAVLHFPGPPMNLRPWPEGGAAAILRDANNQCLWAATPPTDGQMARPVFQPDLDEPYTISGFCLVRVTNNADSEDWIVVLSDFYRDCLLVCDLGGRCLQRLLEVPKPGPLCAEAGEADGSVIVFAAVANGAELRAFEWRRRRLRQRGEAFRHPRLRYARAIDAAAGCVVAADSTASFVFVIDRRRLLDGGVGDDGVGGFACEEAQPIAVAVAELDADGRGCVFVNSVGANQRRCVAVRDLGTGRRLRELPCGFTCACGCPTCVDSGNDADVGALHFDPDRLELLVGRRARANHALVFSFADGELALR